MYRICFILVCLIVISCKGTSEEKSEANTETYEIIPWTASYQAISKMGDTLRSATPSESLLRKYQEKKEAFSKNPDNLDDLIWYGRFTAYTGNYREAIAIYSAGLKQFPNESRLLRHRGHRYITVRQFNKAIDDLSKAAQLIKGKENMVEEDGAPNAQNIPVSTMHGNIYYHLGLAHYLNGDMPAALSAYKKCLETSSNPDNLVSATHWIYMILRRMEQQEAATMSLDRIHPGLTVIENQSYLNACLFYKGELQLKDVYDPIAEANASNSAVKYAVGNWYAYNDKMEQAKGIYNTILSGSDWASFGYIAAEVAMGTMK